VGVGVEGGEWGGRSGGVGCGVWGVGCGVWGVGCVELGVGCVVEGAGVWDVGCGVWGWVWGAGLAGVKGWLCVCVCEWRRQTVRLCPMAVPRLCQCCVVPPLCPPCFFCAMPQVTRAVQATVRPRSQSVDLGELARWAVRNRSSSTEPSAVPTSSPMAPALPVSRVVSDGMPNMCVPCAGCGRVPWCVYMCTIGCVCTMDECVPLGVYLCTIGCMLVYHG
jgi:hypothetical protein